jgi:hypothetical protein
VKTLVASATQGRPGRQPLPKARSPAPAPVPMWQLGVC